MHASPNPPLFCLVELTGLLAYRVPYNRPARTMPWGMEKPGAALWLAAARCAVPQVHVVYAPAVSMWAPIVPGANVIGPEALHARPPDMAQESTHRMFTGSRRARGTVSFDTRRAPPAFQ